MYVAAEITRLVQVSSFYSPTIKPFVVAYRFYYELGNADIADFWKSTFNVTEPLTERTILTGVVFNRHINYSAKDTFDDMLGDAQSYYWDNTIQILYIHLNHFHNIDYVDNNLDYGLGVGLTNDKVRYFENRRYVPFMKDFPAVEVSVDKFNYDQLTFIVDSIKCVNHSSFFNQFKEVPLYGNKVSIYTGEEGDKYQDLIERATFFVEDYNFSASIFDLAIQDVRKTLTAQVPNIILNATDYPHIGDSSLGMVAPFGYGPLRDVPGLCINEKAVSAPVSPQFLFIEELVGSTLADITVWVEVANDTWVEQTSGVSVNWSTGIVTVSGSKYESGGTYGVRRVKANVQGIENTYGSDVIKDLNFRFLGVTYDDSAYDKVGWEIEEKYLAPISLYMDETKDLYEWIRDIQSLSSVGFRYTNSPNNKITIRVDNPNRAIFNFKQDFLSIPPDDPVTTTHTLTSKVTIDCIVRPTFDYDTAALKMIFSYRVDATRRLECFYNAYTDSFTVSRQDGGTNQILVSGTFNADGSGGETKLNQRLRLTFSLDLTTGTNAGSSFRLEPLEVGNVFIDSQWSGNIDAFTTTITALGIGCRPEGTFEWQGDIEYLHIYDNQLLTTEEIDGHLLNRTVPSVHIKNIAKVVAESNKDDVYNKLYIGYDQSILNKTAPKVENIEYFKDSFNEYRIIKVYDKITGLNTEAEAIDRGKIQAEDYHRIRKVFDMDLLGTQYLDLRLYDIITVELSLVKKTFTTGDVIQEVLSSGDEIFEEVIIDGELYYEQRSTITTEDVGDTYFGIVRGQVISIKPDYKYKKNRIRLRERPYSDVWETIYGE